jgi:hypothetical protein
LVKSATGKTLPIVLDLYNCIPIEPLSVTITFTDSGLNNLQVNSLLSRTVYDPGSSTDTKLYFVIE